MKIKVDEYQERARETAIYPGKLLYPTLGLAGETGELLEAILEEFDGTSKEIGDILWYVANVAHDADLKLSECTGTKTFPNGKRIIWTISYEMLPQRVGKIAECVKKAYRDNNGELSEERRSKIREQLKKLVKDLAAIAYNEHTTLDAVAKENLLKLKSRQDRGVLKGDGDNR